MKPLRKGLPTVSGAFRELNEQQAHFLTALIEIGGGHQHGPEAALQAGYGCTYEEAARAARILLKSPKILSALKDAVMHRFDVAATAAVATLVELCVDKAAPANARIAAAESILNRSIGPVPSRSLSIVARTSVEDFWAHLDAQESSSATPAQTIEGAVTSDTGEDEEPE